MHGSMLARPRRLALEEFHGWRAMGSVAADPDRVSITLNRASAHAQTAESIRYRRSNAEAAERVDPSAVLVHSSFTGRSGTPPIKNLTRTCGSKSLDTEADGQLAARGRWAQSHLLGPRSGFEPVNPGSNAERHPLP
jgi:hypothetical protein